MSKSELSRAELLENKIEDMEKKGYGCMFADFGTEKLFPYEMFTSEMMESITALYFVQMTDEIFENGLDSLDGVSYIKSEF